MKKVFTTGQVAKICKVAPRTVSKWFDSGRLRGYRIPGSQDRRIPREQLIKFLKEHGMPLGELEEEEWHKILVIGAEKIFIVRLKELLPEDEDYKYEVANSGFEAGIQAESFHPDTIIIDLGLGRAAGRRDECPHCRAPLHACLNCAAYDETARYGCREPQAEPPRDKDAANYCDFFVFRKGPRAPKEEDPRAKALADLDALFKKK